MLISMEKKNSTRTQNTKEQTKKKDKKNVNSILHRTGKGIKNIEITKTPKNGLSKVHSYHFSKTTKCPSITWL